MTFLGFGRYLGSMELVCSQSELNSALQLVSRAVASRPTHPVLANVLLTADAVTGRVSLTGFDFDCRFNDYSNLPLIRFLNR